MVVLDRYVDQYTIDYDKMMAAIFRPGTNYITDGMRGGGKTFASIAYSWALINGVWPSVGKVVLLTNVVFLKRIAVTPGPRLHKGDFTDKETPEGVIHIDTMEDMFRALSDLYQKYPNRDVLYLVLLDEAQNFFNSYEARSDTSTELQRWFGTLRKFDVCLWMMTPSIYNVPPKGRNFLDNPKETGYLNGIFSKAPVSTSRAMRINQIDGQPYEWIKLQLSHSETEFSRYLRVPITPWNKKPLELKINEFCYDDKASADFAVSNEVPEGVTPFDFHKFMQFVSNKSSLYLPDAMVEFFANLDTTFDSDNEEMKKRVLNQFLMIKEMDKLGLTFISMGKILNMTPQALAALRIRLYKKFCEIYVSPEEKEIIRKKCPKTRYTPGIIEKYVKIDKRITKKPTDSVLASKDNINPIIQKKPTEKLERSLNDQKGVGAVEETFSEVLGVPNGKKIDLQVLQAADQYGVLFPEETKKEEVE